MRIKAPVISTAVAMLAGLVVLFLRLFPAGLEDIYDRIVRGAALLAAVALLVGVVNLINTHADRVSAGGPRAVYSSILLTSLAVTFLFALGLGPSATFLGIQPTGWLFEYIQVPVESSLFALLAVSLIYAAARLLRRSPNIFSIVFLSSALLVLLGGSLLGSGDFGIVSDLLSGLKGWIESVPAAAGARGILLGVALGAIAAGLRILMGADRPFGG